MKRLHRKEFVRHTQNMTGIESSAFLSFSVLWNLFKPNPVDRNLTQHKEFVEKNQLKKVVVTNTKTESKGENAIQAVLGVCNKINHRELHLTRRELK